MAQSRIKIVSRFPAAKAAAHEAVQQARDKALDVGEDEAERRLERIDDTRGYALPTDIQQEKTGHQSGLIRYPEWYGRFFEYGTTYIGASPFMRPAHRKMKKEFVERMGDNFEGFIRRRARLR